MEQHRPLWVSRPAGRDAAGKDVRHPMTQGGAHDLILAVRCNLPGGLARAQ